MQLRVGDGTEWVYNQTRSKRRKPVNKVVAVTCPSRLSQPQERRKSPRDKVCIQAESRDRGREAAVSAGGDSAALTADVTSATVEDTAHSLIEKGVGTVLLLAATALSLTLANLPAVSHTWVSLFEIEAGPRSLGLHLSLREWVNEGVMALFFFVVGLDIKREFVHGSLASLRAAALPCFAAIGGMLAPIGIYVAVNLLRVDGVLNGWAIPMATDIAFAMGVFNAFKRKMPAGVSAFLLTLATVDDLGAIAVIAICFAGSISVKFLGAAAAAVGALAQLDRMKSTNMPAYFTITAVLWYCLLMGGINADIAGVVAAFCVSTKAPAPKSTGAEPEGDTEKPSLVDHLIWKLTPASALFVMPVFALVNTCVPFDASAIGSLLGMPVASGIMLGLLLGKPLGIAGASVLGVQLNLAQWPKGVGASHVLTAGMLGGIGFTMSLFMIEQSLTSALQKSAAKIAILTGSSVAALAGAAMMAVRPSRNASKQQLQAKAD